MIIIVMGILITLRLFAMNNSWAYFAAVLAFILVFWFHNFWNILSSSELPKEISFSTQKKFSKLKVWISAVPVFAAIIQMFLPLGQTTYAHFNSIEAPSFVDESVREAAQEFVYVMCTILSLIYIIFAIVIFFYFF